MRTWFVSDPAAFVTQLNVQQLTESQGAFVLDAYYEGVEHYFPGQRAIRIVHDWRVIRSYTTAVRGRMVRWGLDIRHDLQSIAFLASPLSGAILKMGAAVVVAAYAAVGFNVDVSFSDDAKKFLADQGLAESRDPAVT